MTRPRPSIVRPPGPIDRSPVSFRRAEDASSPQPGPCREGESVVPSSGATAPSPGSSLRCRAGGERDPAENPPRFRFILDRPMPNGLRCMLREGVISNDPIPKEAVRYPPLRLSPLRYVRGVSRAVFAWNRSKISGVPTGQHRPRSSPNGNHLHVRRKLAKNPFRCRFCPKRRAPRHDGGRGGKVWEAV